MNGSNFLSGKSKEEEPSSVKAFYKSIAEKSNVNIKSSKISSLS